MVHVELVTFLPCADDRWGVIGQTCHQAQRSMDQAMAKDDLDALVRKMYFGKENIVLLLSEIVLLNLCSLFFVTYGIILGRPDPPKLANQACYA